MAATPEQLAALSEPFPADEIEWRPGATTRDKSKAIALAYIKKAAVIRRLNDAVGPQNWSVSYERQPDGAFLSTISILCETEDGPQWVSKTDGAGETQVEGFKGAISDSMKRAATQWGVALYLHDLPQQWHALNDRGNAFQGAPKLPKSALPTKGKAAPAPAAPAAPAPDGPAPTGKKKLTKAGKAKVLRAAKGKDKAAVAEVYVRHGIVPGEPPPPVDLDALIAEIESIA